MNNNNIICQFCGRECLVHDHAGYYVCPDCYTKFEWDAETQSYHIVQLHKDLVKPHAKDTILEDIGFNIQELGKSLNTVLVEISAAIGALTYKIDHLIKYGEER